MTVQRTRWRLLTAHTLTTKQHCQFANFWRDRIQRSTIEKLVDLDLDRVFFQRSMISISIALQRSIDRGRSRSRVDRGISASSREVKGITSAYKDSNAKFFQQICLQVNTFVIKGQVIKCRLNRGVSIWKQSTRQCSDGEKNAAINLWHEQMSGGEFKSSSVLKKRFLWKKAERFSNCFWPTTSDVTTKFFDVETWLPLQWNLEQA